LCRSTCAGLRYEGGCERSGDASSRRDAVRHAIESLGGEVKAVYFAFGEADVYVSVRCLITKTRLLCRRLPT
jgi:hypothetical protein